MSATASCTYTPAPRTAWEIVIDADRIRRECLPELGAAVPAVAPSGRNTSS